MQDDLAKFCVLPETANCNVYDGTVLQWKAGPEKCDLEEAQFQVNFEDGSIIHHCSRKPVCPSGGEVSNGSKLVISSKCAGARPTRKFTRTMCKSISHSYVHETLIKY